MPYFIMKKTLQELGQWLRSLIGKKKKPETLKERFDAGLLSREEFLRLKTARYQWLYMKTKKDLAILLKKQTKKQKK